MASQPVSPVAPKLEESPLSRNDGWDLIFSLFDTANELYAPYGGGEAWLRSERAGWKSH